MDNDKTQTPDLGAVTAQLGELLGTAPLKLDVLKTSGRAAVFRCQFADGRSAIAKLHAADTNEARHERAALSFLTGLPEHANALAPRLLARSNDERLIVMEELKGEELTVSLERECEQTIEERLVGFARELGHFHGRVATQLDQLPVSLHDVYRHDAQRARSLLDKLNELLDQAGVQPAPGFDAAWVRVSESLGVPGPFLTLTHGDLAPSNVLFSVAEPTRPRLVDFEYAGARSGLYDVMFWEAAVPFPRWLGEPMTHAYRATLGAHVHDALDDELFSAQLATLKTHRVFWWLSFRLRDALLSGEGEWVPGWPLRRAYLWYLRNHLSSVALLPALQPVFRTAEALHARLSESWNERASAPAGFLSGARTEH